MTNPIIPSPNFVPVLTQEGVVVHPSPQLLALVNKLPANIAAMINTAIASSSNLALELNTDVANGTLTGFTYNPNGTGLAFQPNQNYSAGIIEISQSYLDSLTASANSIHALDNFAVDAQKHRCIQRNPKRLRMQSKSKFELMTNLYWRVFGLILGSVFTLNVVYAALPTSESSSSASATSSANAGSTTCDKPIPFSAEEFMQKLLVVANTQDTRKIPDQFQKLFAVQLQHEPSNSRLGGVVYHLYGSECKWDVYLSIYNVTKALGDRGRIVFLSRAVDPLPFTGGDDACLTPHLLATRLKADGWTYGGNVGPLYVIYEFTKNGADITAFPMGLYGSASNRHSCIKEIDLYLSPTHK